MNHANSIQTEYYDDIDQQENIGFYNHSTQGQSFKKELGTEASNVVVSRIQSNIKDYHQQMKNNKNIINQLECQRKFFEKLSTKQKDKISQIDIEKIKSSYEQKIFQKKQQTSELHEVIANFHEQEQQQEKSFLQTHTKIMANKQFLMETLIQLEKENEEMVREIDASQRQLKQLEMQISSNDNVIKEKQSTHRKYVELQIQIEKLQKKLPKKNCHE